MSRIGVVGAGAMGQGIVQVLLQAGHEVHWLDSRPGATDQGSAQLRKIWQRMAEKQRCTETEAEQWLSHLALASDLAALAVCECVIEAIIESEPEKRALFQQLEAHVAPNAILASNTSSLSITRLASSLQYPGRFAGFHCFNPVPLMPLVEIIEGLRTQPEVMDSLVALALGMNMTAIRVRDTPGFLVNQAGRAYPIESAHLVSEGVAHPHAIDLILKEQAGFRMGPFELMDLTGLDVTQPVTEILFREHFGEPRYRPSVMMALRRDAGLLGRKSGEGFYTYQDGVRSPAQSESSTYAAPPACIWIAATDDAGRQWLEDLAERCGVYVEEGARPSDDALVLVAPLGEDTSAMVSRMDLPAERTIAVDTFASIDRRRVMMPCLTAQAHAISQAAALLSADGVPVSQIRESTGFVTQRVLSLMVNLACDLAQKGVASPIDIDRATQLALGYPRGPLAWGDTLGSDRVLTVLQAIYALSGDPRYRPSAWLRRRVQLGLSLLTEEPRR